MLDELRNIYVEKDITVRLTPDEMTIMKLLIEKLETNSYLPRSEIELKINRIKKDMLNKIIRKLRDKLTRTSIKISYARGLGYYIEKKQEDFEEIYIRKDKIREKIKELENEIETRSLYEENWNKIEVLKELLEEK